jgi:transposase
VESVRTLQGPRQRIVATIGKLPGMDKEERVGWEEIGRILEGKPKPEPDLFEKEEFVPKWATIDLKRVSVERLRHFGDVYPGLVIWKKLGLDEFCKKHLPRGREDVAWSLMSAVLVLARFSAPSSELQVAESWYAKTALDDLLGVDCDKINDDRLYRALDELLPFKDDLCQHLQYRYGKLFEAGFDFLLYDVTSTYFEGSAKFNPQARRGYSRDSRPDCVQVCIGLVATPEGLPLAFEIFDGNRTDVTTLIEIVDTMEKKYGKARRLWVLDRGMTSEENLESLRKQKTSYLVGTSKAMLKRYEKDILRGGWRKVRKDVEVKLLKSPEGSEETFVLCRSHGRKEKEMAILNRFAGKLENGLTHLAAQAQKRNIKKEVIDRRIGRLLERYAPAASLFDIAVTSREKKFTILFKKNDRYSWVCQSSGSYLLRTSWKEKDPATLWKTYIQLTEVEEAFRITKADLGLRPVYHQKQGRVNAHILVCFLALSMWRTLRQWMKSKGLGTAPRKLLEEMREIKSMDVLLPARDKAFRLRLVTTAPKELKILLYRLGLPLPNKPRITENVVVQTLGGQET